MTEKEKNILNQELWALVSLVFDASKHDFEIMEKMIKCTMQEDVEEMTPGKRKIIEELLLQWRFMKELHEDLSRIASRLGKSEIVPEVPKLTFPSTSHSIIQGSKVQLVRMKKLDEKWFPF